MSYVVLSSDDDSTTLIISDVVECPVCGEKSYIMLTIIEGVVTPIILCLSCGYDGSMNIDWISITTLNISL